MIARVSGFHFGLIILIKIIDLTSSIGIQIDSLKNYISTASKNSIFSPKRKKKEEKEEVKDTFCVFFLYIKCADAYLETAKSYKTLNLEEGSLQQQSIHSVPLPLDYISPSESLHPSAEILFS